MTRERFRSLLQGCIIAAGLVCAVGLAYDVREAIQARRGAWGALAEAMAPAPCHTDSECEGARP